VVTRRFFCRTVSCPRKIFAESFKADVLPPRARRTGRLDVIIHALGIALGGRPGAAMAGRLLMPVSNDTLLRLVRGRAVRPTDPLRKIGIDDWALRKNCTYGTVICDLERRRVAALLPDREIATVSGWLDTHPGISVAARDRGGGYAAALRRSLPDAVQVADRWHLMENASAAFLHAVRKSLRAIRRVVGESQVNPDLLTAAERLQYAGWQRREAANEAVLALHKADTSIKEIVRRTGYSRGLVRQILRGARSDIFRTRQSSLDPWLVDLDDLWASGERKAAVIWRHLRSIGYTGALRTVTEWATRRRRSEQVCADTLARVPPARRIARLMTIGRDHLTKAETVLVAAIEAGVPELARSRQIVDDFHKMIRSRTASTLDSWLHEASHSLVASFAGGLVRDIDAVRAAITEPWSNGQTEGQITRLKLIKRQMYGRAKLDLLEARVIGLNK
jgi:transposase